MNLFKAVCALLLVVHKSVAQEDPAIDGTRNEILKMQQASTAFESLKSFMPAYSSDQGIVTMGMIYDQSVLWNANEDVNLEERKEYIDEAMIEVTQKMKRKHNLAVMAEYSILGWQENSALVEYPQLTNDEELLAQVGSHLLKTGVIEQLSIFVDGVMLDVFNTQERQAILEQALVNARKMKAEKNFNLTEARENIDRRLQREKEEERSLREES